ncbi:hypothetical protein OG897_32020 [Streptomyces sp. NBC_00237]|uniref:hypothetical protein n=1 Tax=Streptomyces sp. NBC_00237 TaxID=2975687 RepID=UPI0022537034|nr:hypothetical protein [Streptomyces sp. NBC_00237]MCX5206030.1 hypothetical protein [Streptomyces sp. NBC_00237]
MSAGSDLLDDVPPSHVLDRARQLESAHEALLKRIDPKAVPAALRSRYDTILVKRHRLPVCIRTAQSPLVRLVHFRLLSEHVGFLEELSALPGQVQAEDG